MANRQDWSNFGLRENTGTWTPGTSDTRYRGGDRETGGYNNRGRYQTGRGVQDSFGSSDVNERGGPQSGQPNMGGMGRNQGPDSFSNLLQSCRELIHSCNSFLPHKERNPEQPQMSRFESRILGSGRNADVSGNRGHQGYDVNRGLGEPLGQLLPPMVPMHSQMDPLQRTPMSLLHTTAVQPYTSLALTQPSVVQGMVYQQVTELQSGFGYNTQHSDFRMDSAVRSLTQPAMQLNQKVQQFGLQNQQPTEQAFINQNRNEPLVLYSEVNSRSQSRPDNSNDVAARSHRYFEDSKLPYRSGDSSVRSRDQDRLRHGVRERSRSTGRMHTRDHRTMGDDKNDQNRDRQRREGRDKDRMKRSRSRENGGSRRRCSSEQERHSDNRSRSRDRGGRERDRERGRDMEKDRGHRDSDTGGRDNDVDREKTREQKNGDTVRERERDHNREKDREHRGHDTNKEKDRGRDTDRERGKGHDTNKEDRGRDTDREDRGRDTVKDKDRGCDADRERDKGRDTNREDRGRDTERERDRGRDNERERDKGRDTDRERDKGHDIDREREKGRDTDREKDKGRDTDREKDRGRDTDRERNKARARSGDGERKRMHGHRDSERDSGQDCDNDREREQRWGNSRDKERSWGSDRDKTQGRDSDGDMVQSRNFERDRAQGRDFARDRAQGREFDRDRAPGHDFDRDRAQGRDLVRDNKHSRDYDRGRGHSRDYDRDRAQGRDFDRDRGQRLDFDRDRGHSRGWGGDRGRSHDSDMSSSSGRDGRRVPWVPPPHGRNRASPSGTTPSLPPPLPPPIQNQFRNDGSFMEMFQQQMQATQTDKTEAETTSTTPASAAAAATDTMPVIVPSAAYGVPVIAKRRISKILKTGMVQKTKKVEGTDADDKAKGDAWSRYMQEVNKYRSNKCIEEDATRPLMK